MLDGAVVVVNAIILSVFVLSRTLTSGCYQILEQPFDAICVDKSGACGVVNMLVLSCILRIACAGWGSKIFVIVHSTFPCTSISGCCFSIHRSHARVSPIAALPLILGRFEGSQENRARAQERIKELSSDRKSSP